MAQFAGAPASLAPLVRAVAPSVVGISVTEAAGAHHRQALAAGSGFIIRADGMIVTNDHVIAGARQIIVTLDDGERFPAQRIAADDLTDIAIIKISLSHALAPVHWGDSATAQVGDWVLAAGNPFALGNSFTLGIISAEGRNIGEGPFDHFLQLDAPLNPGNSGGPAFDMQGEVIGINSAIVSPSGGSVGIGFAIPSDEARPIVAALIAHGEVARGWLGLGVTDAQTAPDGAKSGAEITSVEAGGPADRAGLTGGEVVLTVNTQQIFDASGLIRVIASMVPGTKVVLGLRKNGHIYHLPVMVDRRPAQLGE
jgi:serine protease Do